MRKSLLTLVALVLALTCTGIPSFGQGEGNTIILKFAGVPTGTCSFIMMGLNSSNGDLYDCPAGAWVKTGTGGGAGGTVTNTGGPLTANALVLGAGGNDTKVSTALTTNGVGELDVGVNGGAAGVVGWNGSTSGKATCTAPAVAGTITNPVTCTNQFSVPGVQLTVGALPGSATGIFNSASQNIVLLSNAVQWMFGNQNEVLATKPFHMTGGNLLFVTADFTSAANTSLQTITGLAFTHTATNANNWNFHCALSYSQATGNAVVAFGIQAATNAPTNIFANGVQQITVGPPATFVTGTLPTLTTTTATNIVSGTPTATATNYTVELNGTLELAVSANTINFMISTANSADLPTVVRGSYCNIF